MRCNGSAPGRECRRCGLFRLDGQRRILRTQTPSFVVCVPPNADPFLANTSAYGDARPRRLIAPSAQDDNSAMSCQAVCPATPTLISPTPFPRFPSPPPPCPARRLFLDRPPCTRPSVSARRSAAKIPRRLLGADSLSQQPFGLVTKTRDGGSLGLDASPWSKRCRGSLLRWASQHQRQCSRCSLCNRRACATRPISSPIHPDDQSLTVSDGAPI
ncbi:hypothetical protein DFH06DRAFT_560111 [Mycena polygramma]|nr:hypothetical protein DFH06DRAFT_560111 [Mycena polygramma]